MGDAGGDRGRARLGKAWGALIEPFKLAGAPLTFRADEGDEHVRSAFGEAKYARLVALKDKYDPDNLFRLNQNIKPSGAGLSHLNVVSLYIAVQRHHACRVRLAA